MTEKEWLATTDRHIQFTFLSRTVSERKMRLFACAGVRAFWHLLRDKDSQRTVEIAEQFADGRADSKELARGWDYAADAATHAGRQTVPLDAIEEASIEPKFDAGYPFDADDINANVSYLAACTAAKSGLNAAYTLALHWPYSTDRPVWVDLLLCVVGPAPFRRVFVNAKWSTSTVVTLAEGIYAERAFDRMPILADALEDAGCDNADVLNHCRGDGTHVRGCWVVDLLTGRK